MARPDLRRADEIRKCRIAADWLPQADGSALIEMGKTRVLCTAMVQDAEQAELTAQYRLHPRIGGEPQDERLTRILSTVLRKERLGSRRICVDCEVLADDGGAFCAAVTGAFAALWKACAQLVQSGELERVPLSDSVAAIRTAVSGGEPVADPSLAEQTDCIAEVVINGRGQFVEVSVQGGAFEKEQLVKLTALARRTGMKLIREQKKITGDI